MNKNLTKNNCYNTLFIHIAMWLFLFAMPIFFMDRSNGVSWGYLLKSTSSLLFSMIVFYVNYFILIDKYLFKYKTREFLIINLILIIGVAVVAHFSYEFINSLQLDGPPRRKRRHSPPPATHFIIRDFIFLVLVGGLSVALKMSNRWHIVQSEHERLKKDIAEAELQNLKNQISPHFLLNTLNNIYALIEFAPDKAKTAVEDLSKLLRHLLYDNNKEFVPITQEVDFIRNYVELMKMRLSDNVDLTLDIKLQHDINTKIAPLIFISLIENAFKHGVSANKPSFIKIEIDERPDGLVDFRALNSYFPKSSTDLSGSGIGLKQVQKRLDMFYPQKYIWNKSIVDNVYSVTLQISTNNAPFLLDN